MAEQDQGPSKIDLSWHFAVPIYQCEIGAYAAHEAAVLKRIQALREQDQGMSRSNRRGWHSADSFQLDKDPSIAWLMQELLKFTTGSVQNFMQGQQMGPLVMTSCWANINPAGGWNAPHMHLPAEWSGVFYAKVEEDHFNEPGDGELMFLDPLPFGEQFKRGGTVSLRPRTGLAVLFPSYLMHMVAPHHSESERISIAFNCRVAPPGFKPGQSA